MSVNSFSTEHTHSKDTIDTNMSTTKNTKNNNTTTIQANSNLTRPQRGELIRHWLPEIKKAFPDVRYIRLDEEDGGDLYWIFTSTSDNKKVAEMLRKGEQGVINKGNDAAQPGSGRAVTKTLNEHQWGKELTGIVIRKMTRGLELPEGANPPRFNNETRQWSFRAKTQEALDEVVSRFKDLEKRCANIYDPPVRYHLEARKMSTEKRTHKFTSTVINRLREVQLPKDAARIRFDNKEECWRFACQTNEDMDLLLERFNNLEKDIYDEFTYPVETPSTPVEPDEKVSAPMPDISGADFPVLPTTPSAT